MKSSLDTNLVGPYRTSDANKILGYRFIKAQLQMDYRNAEELGMAEFNDLIEFIDNCRHLLSLPVRNDAFSHDELREDMDIVYEKIVIIAEHEILNDPSNQQLNTYKARSLQALGRIEAFEAYENAIKYAGDNIEKVELMIEYGICAEEFDRIPYGMMFTDNNDIDTAIRQYHSALDLIIENELGMDLLNKVIDGLGRIINE